jgi:hypothetical protein
MLIEVFVAAVKEVTVAAPKIGVTRVGEVLNTRLVEVVPVVPEAVNPVVLLNEPIPGDEVLVPPLAIGRTPVELARLTPPPAAFLRLGLSMPL